MRTLLSIHIFNLLFQQADKFALGSLHCGLKTLHISRLKIAIVAQINIDLRKQLIDRVLKPLTLTIDLANLIIKIKVNWRFCDVSFAGAMTICAD